MNQLIALASCVLLAVSSAAQPPKITRLPPLHEFRSARIDVQHLDINLKFNWDKKQAYGTTTITLAPLTATNRISLDAGMLTINSIKLPGGKKLSFDYDGGDKDDGLMVTLDRTYKAGETVQLVVDYHTNQVNMTDPNNLWGSYGKGLRFFQPTSTEPRKRKQIWSMGEPSGNRYWFPGYDAPDDFRTTDFTATVDKKLSVIANGTLVESTDNADGTHTVHWKMDKPYANHHTSFVIGEYVNIQRNANGVAFNTYAYPDERAATEASTARLTDMLKFFSDKIGTPYPYPTYNQVFVQEIAWAGVHNAGLSTITENMVDDYGTHADFFYLWDGVEAQDVAAQWFANLLTPRDWSQVWLSKSLDRYFDCMYSEYKNGHQEMVLNNLRADVNTYLTDWGSGLRRPLVTKYYDSAQLMTTDNYAMIHGASVFHMLRKHLGDDNWWKGIRLYVQNNAGKTVTVDDFQKAMESASGEQLGWFFDQWVYKMGHPVFVVSEQYNDQKKQLVLTVKQTQKTDPNNEYPQVEFFKGKMDIEIDDRIEHIWIEPRAEQTFTFSVEQQPKLVDFDYEGTWVKKVTFEKPFEELLYQAQYDKDILGKNWAQSELVRISKLEKTTAEDKQKIYAAFRNVMGSDAYWRIRYSAMLQLQSMLVPRRKAVNVPLDDATRTLLLNIINKENSWNKAAAVLFLGSTSDPAYTDLYIRCLDDKSDRVVNSAAISLGKTKSPKAYDVLYQLKDKPSWKNQSLISTLDGFKELGDPRGVDLALTAVKDPASAPRWTLLTSVWDFRFAGAETLVALGRADLGYPVVLERFKKSMAENDVNDIFSNVQMVTTLADPRGQEVFDAVRAKFKNDPAAIKALDDFEQQFKNAIRK